MESIGNAARGPGWAGSTVVVRKLDSDGNPQDYATVSLKEGNGATCDNADLMQKWSSAGIVGRADHGKVFPSDGQKFLDELPYTYKSPYFWAEPASRTDRGIG